MANVQYDMGPNDCNVVFTTTNGGISVHQGYKALEKCKELELVKSRIDNTSYPARNMISLTPKGKKVAELLKKIEEVLES